jgi:nucleoside-diphosphate-sugar epimerase/sorbitol-specific phosphotransferase system component IIC
MPAFRTRFNSIRQMVTVEGAIRLVADVIMINIAVILALLARILYEITVSPPQTAFNLQNTMLIYVDQYISSAWLLTLICVVIFTASGFYTYGRFYRSRYKLLMIVQAVSVSFLIFGSLVYFVGIEEFVYIPRGAFIIAWVLVLAFLVGARVWTLLWGRVASAERQQQEAPAERKVGSVLVIGGAGYIGSALLPKLLERGYQVKLLDLLIFGTEPIQEYLEHPNLTVMQADFRQIDKVVEAVDDVDAVIHLGAIVGDPACAVDDKLTVDINLMATRMIAEVAKGSGVERFIFASTCSVYGASDQMLDERSELNPVSLYARSKIASEKVLFKMANDRFAPVILRFGTIYGLSGRTRFDLVVNLLSAKAVVDKQITVYGGDQWRPFLHVDDAALSLLKVLEAPLGLVQNQIFNVGSNEQNYTIKQIAEIVNEQAPEAEVLMMDSGDDRRNYWVNFNKIHNTLGFSPQWTVAGGVSQVIEAIRSGRVTDYTDARYSNVKFLTEEGLFRLTRSERDWAIDLLNGQEAI